MSSDVATVVGFVGTALIVAAYVYITAQKTPNPFVLHGMNFTGATLLVLSLLVNTNLPALVLEGIWAAVAVWGLFKALLSRESPSRLREGLGVGESGGTGPPPAPPASGKGEA